MQSLNKADFVGSAPFPYTLHLHGFVRLFFCKLTTDLLRLAGRIAGGKAALTSWMPVHFLEVEVQPVQGTV